MVTSQPRALLLDLDDTLVDDSRLNEAIRNVCDDLAREQPALDADELFDINARIWSDHWAAVGQSWTLGQLTTRTFLLDVWSRTLSTCGNTDEQLVQYAVTSHTRHEPKTYRLFPDAQRFLQERPDLPLALISNGASDLQRTKLDTLDIAHHFDTMVFSADHGVAKPDPTLFITAADHLGLDPSELWHVGDSLTGDVAGAKNAGCGAVWLNRTQQPRPKDTTSPDHEIHNLLELLELLSEH